MADSGKAPAAPADEAKVDHTKGHDGGVVKLDSDTPPQAPKAERYVPPKGEGAGGAYDPETQDPMEIVAKEAPPENIMPAQKVAGATDYKNTKYTPGPAPGDIVVQ